MVTLATSVKTCAQEDPKTLAADMGSVIRTALVNASGIGMEKIAVDADKE